VAGVALAVSIPDPAQAQGLAASPTPVAPKAETTNRTVLKPGWNMFSESQDVELGRQAAQEVSQQVLLLNNKPVDDYVTKLGQRLAAHAPGFQFPYVFQTVNDRGINAFALPGGHIYINRGVIEAADNESQLAGVMAHEIAHVALRHGTNQASKAAAAQMPLAILGGLLGGNSTTAALAQLGAGFTVHSILLKYSRDAERQADLLATQILFDAGLEPRAMGQFFGKIEGSNGLAFFNSHPSPDGRIEKANEEASKLGAVARSDRRGSQEFMQIKRHIQALPSPRPNQLQAQQKDPPAEGGTSDRFLSFENAILRISYPDNWQAFGQGDAVTIAPDGGMVKDSEGNQALASGLLVSIYEPYEGWHGQQLMGPGSAQSAQVTIEAATDQLVQELRQSNRNLRVVRRHEQIDVGRQRGLSTYLSNDSPASRGGRETNWLVTLLRPEGLLFFVFTAPERQFQSYEHTFQEMLYSVRLRQ
jgi:Zn-dependent protease with chaperone function